MDPELKQSTFEFDDDTVVFDAVKGVVHIGKNTTLFNLNPDLYGGEYDH